MNDAGSPTIPKESVQYKPSKFPRANSCVAVSRRAAVVSELIHMMHLRCSGGRRSCMRSAAFTESSMLSKKITNGWIWISGFQFSGIRKSRSLKLDIAYCILWTVRKTFGRSLERLNVVVLPGVTVKVSRTLWRTGPGRVAEGSRKWVGIMLLSRPASP